MQTMLGLLIALCAIAVFLLWRVVLLLADIKDNTRDTAFHARRIPIDPID
jgi:hypothetical protein